MGELTKMERCLLELMMTTGELHYRKRPGEDIRLLEGTVKSLNKAKLICFKVAHSCTEEGPAVWEHAYALSSAARALVKEGETR